MKDRTKKTDYLVTLYTRFNPINLLILWANSTITVPYQLQIVSTLKEDGYYCNIWYIICIHYHLKV